MKKVLLILVVFILILSVGFIPSIVLSEVKPLNVVLPYHESFPSSVDASGVVKNQHVETIISPSDMMLQETLIESGQWVAKNTMIARGRDVSNMGDYIPPIYQSVLSTMSEDDLSLLMKEYETEIAAQKDEALDNCPTVDIYAPTDGILQWEPSPTNQIIPQQTLLGQVSNNASPTIQIFLPTEYTTMVAVGGGVSFSDDMGKQYLGRIASINTSNDTLQLTVRLPDTTTAPPHLSTVTCQVRTATQHDFYTLPYTAINQDEDSQEYVHLYKDGTLIKQLIVTGQEFNDSIEIVSGIIHTDIIALGESLPLDARYQIASLTNYEGELYDTK